MKWKVCVINWSAHKLWLWQWDVPLKHADNGLKEWNDNVKWSICNFGRVRWLNFSALWRFRLIVHICDLVPRKIVIVFCCDLTLCVLSPCEVSMSFGLLLTIKICRIADQISAKFICVFLRCKFVKIELPYWPINWSCVSMWWPALHLWWWKCVPRPESFSGKWKLLTSGSFQLFNWAKF